MDDIDLTMMQILHDKKEPDIFKLTKAKNALARLQLFIERGGKYPWHVANYQDQSNAFNFSPYHEHYGQWMSKPNTTCDRCGCVLYPWDMYCLCIDCNNFYDVGVNHLHF